MAIDISRYINITSTAAGASQVANRELMARIFTGDSQAPNGVVLEFDSLDQVGQYFYPTQQAYLAAAAYFSYIGVQGTSPSSISISGAGALTGTINPMVIGAPINLDITEIQQYAGVYFYFGLLEGTITKVQLGELTTIEDGDELATLIQTAVVGGGLTGFTCSWDSVKNRFTLTHPTAADSYAVCYAGNDTGGDVTYFSNLLGITVEDPESGSTVKNYFPNGEALTQAVSTLGSSTQATAVDIVSLADSISNNYGSFGFTFSHLTAEQSTAVANWNKSKNNSYMFSIPVDFTDINTTASVPEAVRNIGGCAVTLDPYTAVFRGFSFMLPMAILASTDFTRPGASINYMFRSANLPVYITTDAAANSMDALRVNYYGQTQTAGQQLAFYQRGYMMGLSTDALDMQTYSNEIWLKDAIQVEIMNGLLASGAIPANNQGAVIILSLINPIIEQAQANGVILAGKVLSTAQKLAVSQLTGNPDAWIDVQNIGYYLTASVSSSVVNGATEYAVNYLLVYSKSDSIRSVTGSHILI